jgi:sigma-B regulation protein RsbU (phosphoserine phosphatase)
MISQGELVGVLNLGKKADDEDFSMADIDLITQASTQTALALQNIKLQSVYIEKKRIDKELELARNIQRRLLPRELPIVKGLEVYGESRSCFEVAGDYFDIINIDNDNTVFVVADVSGKGAGAAMIMANLQASIRVGIEISENLSNFVKRINNHVYNHTSSAEFITFFMGIWVPGENALYYVNAGHNPPILLDKENKVKRLEATGLVLGVMDNQEYKVEKVFIDPGSLLLIYTDGIEEAINQNNELFGTQRIIDLLKTHRNSQPQRIAEELNKAVVQFSGNSPICDDITMIIVKRT